jgi:UDP-N-acetylmuramate: L-alanyl-gamma-D-glutamyl-meso-diaminopimelate ligase
VGNTVAGDQVLIMSNGGFGGLHGKLLEALSRQG